MFISPHNKIIVSNYQGIPVSPYCIINNPDSAGLACNFQKEALSIPSALTYRTLPNIVNLKLGALVGSGCDTITAIPAFTPPSGVGGLL